MSARSSMLSRGFCNLEFCGGATALTSENVNIGINHGFQCSNIRWITRKVFEHKAAGRVFKHLPSDPANVRTLKQTMVDRYSCIFTLIHLKSFENNISNVKTHRKQRSFFNVGHFVSTKHITSRRIDQ